MTEQKFRVKLQWRIGFSVLLFMIGVFLAFLVFDAANGTAFTRVRIGGNEVFFRSITTSDFNSGYYLGVSFGIMGTALATLIKNIIMLKNEKAFKNQYIKETDERNIQIFRRSYGVAWLSTIFAMLIATFFVSSETLTVLLTMTGFSALIYFISFVFFQKT